MYARVDLDVKDLESAGCMVSQRSSRGLVALWRPLTQSHGKGITISKLHPVSTVRKSRKFFWSAIATKVNVNHRVDPFAWLDVDTHGTPVCLDYDLRPSNKLVLLPFPSSPLPPLGRYVTFGLFAIACAISLAASIFLICTSPSPALAIALLMISAESASPSARMTLACRSCSDFSTVNLARSASCCAICFCSTARVNSRPKVM